jgi:hypothetical protein
MILPTLHPWPRNKWTPKTPYGPFIPEKKHGTHCTESCVGHYGSKETCPQRDFELLPSSPEEVAIPSTAENTKNAPLQYIHNSDSFVVILSAKQERIFGTLV